MKRSIVVLTMLLISTNLSFGADPVSYFIPGYQLVKEGYSEGYFYYPGGVAFLGGLSLITYSSLENNGSMYDDSLISKVSLLSQFYGAACYAAETRKLASLGLATN